MTNDIFTVRALQAENGDCLFVTYGSNGDRHHLLIDGGNKKTASSLLEMLVTARAGRAELVLEALVITHFDTDHIDGIDTLLNDKPDWLVIKDVWFNGQHHLYEKDELAKLSGNKLTKNIRRLKLPWNQKFEGHAIKSEADALEQRELPGGLKVTFLSPGVNQLQKLKAKWPRDKAEPESFVEAASSVEGPADILGKKDTWPPKYSDLYDAPFIEDGSTSNGSSIAMILEFGGKRALMSGDAYASVLVKALRAFNSGNPVDIDLYKVSHHGSLNNTNAELIRLLNCKIYLITTNGATHQHPDHVAIAKILKYGKPSPQLIFNYKCATTKNWGAGPLKSPWPKFRVRYPNSGETFVEVKLI